eukprot:EG_transcript_13449
MAAAVDFARRCLRYRWVVGPGPLLVRSRPLLYCHGDSALRPFSSSSPPPPTSNDQKTARLEHRMPTAAVQAHLAQCGVDVHKVVQRYPPMASYSVERVRRVTDYLAGLGVDVKRAVEGHPRLLAGKVENYTAVVHVLQDNGVDVARAAKCYPSILKRRVATVQRTMDTIASCGSVADIVNRDPRLLRASASNISLLSEVSRLKSGTIPSGNVHAKVALLSSLGLDSRLLLKRRPGVLMLNAGKLQATVDYLKCLNVDVQKVVHSAPALVGLRIESMQQRVQFLTEHGLDVVQCVNGFPTILALSVERKLRPILKFVVEEMGRSPSELNGAHSIWGYDLKGRLRPRFCYLKSLGQSAGNLSTFGSCSDVRFATRIAKTDLQEYYAWRIRNGHSVTQPGSSLARPVPT